MLSLGNCKKLVTFSFDDGNTDDIRLVEILNRYGLKATFNLCSGLPDSSQYWIYEGKKEVRHINFCESKKLYDGHEIASHTVCHPHLEELTEVEIRNEIELDCIYLNAFFGCNISGMALPFGTYNETVLKTVKDLGLHYCRTVSDTYSFDLPEKLPLLDPTCHFLSERMPELIDRFAEYDGEDYNLFYIWGHSYELVIEKDWSNFEKTCSEIASLNGTAFCTNREALMRCCGL